jgi:hypothetical protein
MEWVLRHSIMGMIGGGTTKFKQNVIAQRGWSCPDETRSVMSEEQTVTYELEGEIALVGLNRPDKRNCFNPTVMKQLRAAIERAGEEAKCGIIFGMATTSAPGSICAGPRRAGRPGARNGCRSSSTATPISRRWRAATSRSSRRCTARRWAAA